MADLAGLLARWHQWRRGYSHERGYARASMVPDNDDDELELLTMRAIDAAVLQLPQELQIAAQHIARAECLGVEVIMNPRLGNKVERETLVARAMAELHRRLKGVG